MVTGATGTAWEELKPKILHKSEPEKVLKEQAGVLTSTKIGDLDQHFRANVSVFIERLT